MTIMDRLARKGIVERKKSGRAYIYRANLTAEEARIAGLGQVVENFLAVQRSPDGATEDQPAAASPLVPLRALRAAAGGFAHR